MKKILTFTLALVSILVLCSISVFAAEGDAVAKIGDEYYVSLQDAIDAAQNGEVIVLQSNIELTSAITVSKNSNAVLDLAGYSITQVVECTKSYDMILNKGTLSITDSVGGGKISLTDTSAGGGSNWGAYTIRNEGNLTVDTVTIENLSAQNADGTFKHTVFAIFQYCGSCTINSGTISTPYYRSIRLWKGDMTINGGIMDGQVWVQCVDNTASMTINGGSFSPNNMDGSSVFVTNTYDAEFSVTDGYFETKIGCSDASALAGAVTGGTFSEAAINAMGASSALFATAPVENADGSYSVPLSLEAVFTFLGYSVNNERDAITAGYTVDQEYLAKWCTQNSVDNFDFGCIFGIGGEIADSSATSFAKYTEYQTFNVKITGIDKTNVNHINAALSLALYIDRGNGKEYVVEVDEKIDFVDAATVPTVTFASFLN